MFPIAAIFLSFYVASVSSSSKNLSRRFNTSVAAAYYAGWHSEDFPLADVSWEKYTHLIYSFAETVPDPSDTPSLNGSEPEMLLPFVQAAHANNVAAMVSVGGWTGSLHFSTNVGNAANRTAFVKSVVSLAQRYDVDGVDFDWEYPGTQGIGCNAISVNDTANFLLFLQELREDPIGKDLVLTAPTSINPWVDSTGAASTDVSGFSQVFDFITIMNYDIWGPWSATTGPNAPLYDSCESKINQQGSAMSAVKAWNEAGMPLNQIVLGVASYGHSFSVNISSAFSHDDSLLATYPPFNASIQPVGDSWDDATGNDVCGNPQGPGGDMDFWGLIEGGWLTEKGVAADGIAYVYDQCDRTPRVYNETMQDYIAFDDASSFAEKGKFIKAMGLRGFGMWEAGGDYKDILLDSIRSSSGLF